MNYQIIGSHHDIAYVQGEPPLITDVQSALDLMMTVKYETGCQKLILDKACVTEDFFVLSTGVAGEILEKFVTYHVALAIVGDYSGYTSKPLRDFIYESNQGRQVFFPQTLDQAVEYLERL